MAENEKKEENENNVEDLKEKELNEKTDKFQQKIFRLKVAEFVCSGILLLSIGLSLFFLMKLIIKAENPNHQEIAEILSIYTGIVLGFVAMTVSLIGMILGFHNTIQADQSSLDTMKEFIEVKYSIETVKKLESSLEEILKNLGYKLTSLDKLEEIQNKLDIVSEDIKNSLENNKGNTSNRTNSTETVKKDFEMETDEGEGFKIDKCNE